MSRIPRCRQIDPDDTCEYHLYSRGAQGLLLFEDEACKTHAYERLRQFHTNFAIEVLTHNFMGNHFHMIVRMDPIAAACWTPREVIRRWYGAHPGGKGKLSEKRIQRHLNDHEWIEAKRQALASVSQFMKDFKQAITQWINHNHGTRGTAWQERFGSKPIHSRDQLIYTAAYIDLNPVAAGLFFNPHEAPFSSAHERWLREKYANPDDLMREVPLPPGVIGVPPMGDADPKHRACTAANPGPGHRGQPLIRGASDRDYLRLLDNLAPLVRKGSCRATGRARRSAEKLGTSVARLLEFLRSMYADPRFAPT